MHSRLRCGSLNQHQNTGSRAFASTASPPRYILAIACTIIGRATSSRTVSAHIDHFPIRRLRFTRYGAGPPGETCVRRRAKTTPPRAHAAQSYTGVGVRVRLACFSCARATLADTLARASRAACVMTANHNYVYFVRTGVAYRDARWLLFFFSFRFASRRAISVTAA